ncbi:hypothetical protein ISS08_01185 [Candidatus Pacearchaeota archaeon]|nr:hypothetical protein [Candidatus Pacearchaeota archaeon]
MSEREIDQKKLEELFEENEKSLEEISEENELEEILDEDNFQGGVDQFSRFLSNNKISVLEKVETFEEPANLEQEILNISSNNFSTEIKSQVENKPIYSAEVEEIYRTGQNSIEPPVLKSEFRDEPSIPRIDLLDPMKTRSGMSTFSEPETLRSKDVDNSKYTSIKD